LEESSDQELIEVSQVIVVGFKRAPFLNCGQNKLKLKLDFLLVPELHMSCPHLMFKKAHDLVNFALFQNHQHSLVGRLPRLGLPLAIGLSLDPVALGEIGNEDNGHLVVAQAHGLLERTLLRHVFLVGVQREHKQQGCHLDQVARDCQVQASLTHPVLLELEELVVAQQRDHREKVVLLHCAEQVLGVGPLVRPVRVWMDQFEGVPWFYPVVSDALAGAEKLLAEVFSGLQDRFEFGGGRLQDQ
jgi:hypothetical protein